MSIHPLERLCPDLDPTNLWVFAYGSLMWESPFPAADARLTMLYDYERRFCMSSVNYRGTFDNPGLVLALDRVVGGNCTGVSYRIAHSDATDVLAYLRDRELNTSGYIERLVSVVLDNGSKVLALAYVIDPSNQFYRDLSIPHQADIISRAEGIKGPNYEYLFKTIESLDERGVADPQLSVLVSEVKARLSRV